MANFAVTTTTFPAQNLDAVLAAMETYIETVDDSKTIYLYGVERVGDLYEGGIVHST